MMTAFIFSWLKTYVNYTNRFKHAQTTLLSASSSILLRYPIVSSSPDILVSKIMGYINTIFNELYFFYISNSINYLM